MLFMDNLSNGSHNFPLFINEIRSLRSKHNNFSRFKSDADRLDLIGMEWKEQEPKTRTKLMMWRHLTKENVQWRIQSSEKFRFCHLTIYLGFD